MAGNGACVVSVSQRRAWPVPTLFADLAVLVAEILWRVRRKVGQVVLARSVDEDAQASATPRARAEKKRAA